MPATVPQMVAETLALESNDAESILQFLADTVPQMVGKGVTPTLEHFVTETVPQFKFLAETVGALVEESLSLETVPQLVVETVPRLVMETVPRLVMETLGATVTQPTLEPFTFNPFTQLKVTSKAYGNRYSQTVIYCENNEST